MEHGENLEPDRSRRRTRVCRGADCVECRRRTQPRCDAEGEGRATRSLHPNALQPGGPLHPRPLRGRTYYGSYQGREYAVAVFSIPRLGTQDQPEVFRRPRGGVWRDLGDTGGDICPPTIPLSLLKVWNFQRSSTTESNGRSVQCYAPRP